jgi:hypothetical protein
VDASVNHFNSLQANASFDSSTMHGELLGPMDIVLRARDLEKIRQSSLFSFDFDEAKDASRTAKLALNFHVTTEEGEVSSILAALIRVGSTEGLPTLRLILRWVQANQIDLARCVGAAGDGAGGVMGKKKGAIPRLLVLIPWAHGRCIGFKKRFLRSFALCRHCRGHRVALVVTHSTKDVSFVFRKLVGDETNPGFLQSAYLLFKASPKRLNELMQCCRHYGVLPARPPRAQTTRWDSILQGADTDAAIAVPLFGWSAAHANSDPGALGLLHSMRHVYWYLGISMLQDVLKPLRVVSKVLSR